MTTYSKYITLCFVLLTTSVLSAQNVGDALRYSFTNPSGTARFMGAGAALGPLGADFSVLSTNPAGLAWTRKSEFMLTPGVHANTSNAKLVNGGNNLAFDDTAIKFTLPNMGLIASGRGGRDLEVFSFAMGINKLADFNQQFYYKGKSVGSIIQRFEELANSSGLDQFEAGVAFDADALILDNGLYLSDFSSVSNRSITREETINRSGYMTELSLGFAGNVQNTFLWGLSLGIPIIEYQEEKLYNEIDLDDKIPVFDQTTYRENTSTTGSGINLKLGLIYRINQAVRLSAAVHTPTLLTLNDSYSTDLEYNYTLDDTAYNRYGESPIGEFDYSLRTPWKLLGGIGVVFSKNGFISGELEYVNYAKNKFLFDGFTTDEAITNNNITEGLASAIKIRTGAEYAIGSFRLRGGVGFQQAPIIDDNTFYHTASVGMGFRQKSYYIDLGYQRQGQESTYTPYLTSDANQQFVNTNIINENIALTVGFRW